VAVAKFYLSPSAPAQSHWRHRAYLGLTWNGDVESTTRLQRTRLHLLCPARGDVEADSVTTSLDARIAENVTPSCDHQQSWIQPYFARSWGLWQAELPALFLITE